MNVKKKLKERLLDIPARSTAYREAHSLADNIEEDIKMVEFYLKELTQLNILTEKIQYCCPCCNDTTIMSNEVLQEFMDMDEGCFECDNCMEYINPNVNTTGFIYYDVRNEEALELW